MTTTKVYVVSRIGWEYNDSTYDREGSIPEKVFLVKSKAEKYCRELNLIEAKSWEESIIHLEGDNYNYYLRDWDDLVASLPEIPDHVEDLTDENWESLMDYLGVYFYEVVEVDAE